MVSVEPPKIPDGRAELYAAAQAALVRSSLFARMPAVLRSRFYADKAIARCAEIWKLALIGAVAFETAVLLSCFVIFAHPDWPLAYAQLTLVPAAILLTARFACTPKRSAIAREAALLVVCGGVSFAATFPLSQSPAETAVNDMFFASATVIAVLFLTRMPMISALAFVMFSAGQIGLALHGRLDIAPEIRYYPLGFLLMIALPALYNMWRLHNAERRIFLHNLVQVLRIEHLSAENCALDHLSTTDMLTGTANRRRFELFVNEARHPGEGRHLLLIDLDNFKHLNDTHGHQAGDVCLQETANLLRGNLTDKDLLARFGGDEFAVVLMGKTSTAAKRIAEDLCRAVAVHRIALASGRVRASITIGGSEWPEDVGPDQILSRADGALYAAKRAGRGRVRWANSQDSDASSAHDGDALQSSAA